MAAFLVIVALFAAVFADEVKFHEVKMTADTVGEKNVRHYCDELYIHGRGNWRLAGSSDLWSSKSCSRVKVNSVKKADLKSGFIIDSLSCNKCMKSGSWIGENICKCIVDKGKINCDVAVGDFTKFYCISEESEPKCGDIDEDDCRDRDDCVRRMKKGRYVECRRAKCKQYWSEFECGLKGFCKWTKVVKRGKKERMKCKNGN